MSDFLTRLVTATYEPEASLRPRPVAYFEPLGVTMSEWEDEDVALPAAPETAPLPHAPNALARKQQPAVPQPIALNTQPAPLPAQPVTADTRREPAPPPDLPTGAHAPANARQEQLFAPSKQAAAQQENTLLDRRKHTQATASPFAGSHPMLKTSSSSSQENAGIDDRKPAAPPAAEVRAAPQAQTRTLLSTVQQRSAPAAAVPSPQHTPLAARRQHEVMPAAPAAQPDQVHGDAPAGEHALAPRSLNARRKASEVRPGAPQAPSETAPAPTSAAPTIRVTIGRIVLKPESAPPSKPSQSRAAARPGLSLDDYLKARHGGDA